LFSLTAFEREYDTEKQPITIAGRKFEFYTPRTLDPFIPPSGSISEFPLWAKIWQGAVVLADYFARMPVPENAGRLLEIGAGIGVAGVVAAARGYSVTITDYNPHALKFAQANAVVNRCADCVVRRLDWSRPDLPEHYETIIGSEIIYKEDSIQRIKHLFEAYLEPRGRIILAEEPRKTLSEFYRQMAEGFDIRIEKMMLRSAEEQFRLYLIHMRFKP
jgi:predicted nicotinamide N-methyase